MTTPAFSTSIQNYTRGSSQDGSERKEKEIKEIRNGKEKINPRAFQMDGFVSVKSQGILLKLELTVEFSKATRPVHKPALGLR